MAINFCKHIFQPSIRCDSVSVDGYEVEKLVAEHRSAFLSESFVKPPINIYVSLPCNVDIARIVIQSAHGAQRSCGFEIFTQCCRINSSWLLQDGVKPTATDYSNIMACVGKSYQDSKLFCFENVQFKNRFPELGSNGGGTRNSVVATTLSHRYQRHLSSVSEVCVRIMRAANGGVCAIGWLEIWGQPAYACSAPLVAKVLQLHRQSVGDIDNCHINAGTKDIINRDTPFHTVSENHRTDLKESSSEVPQEFLDIITQQLMSVPMLLPSGHSVDRSTIDRHSHEEQLWGRAPSDPFTGVPFSAGVAPVFDVALKARIDKFLLMQKNNLSDLPNGRTVGDARYASNNISRLVANSMSTIGKQIGGTSKRNTTAQTKLTDVDGRVINEKYANNTNSSFDLANADKSAKVVNRTAKRRFDVLQKQTQVLGTDLSNQHKCKKLSCVGSDAIGNALSKQLKVENTGNQSTTLLDYSTRMSEHERNISESLQSALNATLGGLPSFHCHTVGVSKSDVSACQDCGNQVEDARYQLSCDHWICRMCALNKHGRDVICGKCYKQTAHAQIVRIHEYKRS